MKVKWICKCQEQMMQNVDGQSIKSVSISQLNLCRSCHSISCNFCQLFEDFEKFCPYCNRKNRTDIDAIQGGYCDEYCLYGCFECPKCSTLLALLIKKNGLSSGKTVKFQCYGCQWGWTTELEHESIPISSHILQLQEKQDINYQRFKELTDLYDNKNSFYKPQDTIRDVHLKKGDLTSATSLFERISDNKNNKYNYNNIIPYDDFMERNSMNLVNSTKFPKISRLVSNFRYKCPSCKEPILDPLPTKSSPKNDRLESFASTQLPKVDIRENSSNEPNHYSLIFRNTIEENSQLVKVEIIANDNVQIPITNFNINPANDVSNMKEDDSYQLIIKHLKTLTPAELDACDSENNKLVRYEVKRRLEITNNSHDSTQISAQATKLPKEYQICPVSFLNKDGPHVIKLNYKFSTFQVSLTCELIN